MLGRLKPEVQNAATELERQNKMMAQVIKNFDDTRYKILNVEDKLTNSVASIDLCKLYACIGFEVFVVIVLLLT